MRFLDIFIIAVAGVNLLNAAARKNFSGFMGWLFGLITFCCFAI